MTHALGSGSISPDLDQGSQPVTATRTPTKTTPRAPIRVNLSSAELYEDAVRAGEGLLAAAGPLPSFGPGK